MQEVMDNEPTKPEFATDGIKSSFVGVRLPNYYSNRWSTTPVKDEETGEVRATMRPTDRSRYAPRRNTPKHLRKDQ